MAAVVVHMARGLGWHSPALNSAMAVNHATGPGLASNILLQSPSGSVYESFISAFGLTVYFIINELVMMNTE